MLKSKVCQGVKCFVQSELVGMQSVPGSKMIWEAKCSSALMHIALRLSIAIFHENMLLKKSLRSENPSGKLA